MVSKNALAAFISLAFLSPLALACGNTSDADAEPNPAEPVEVGEIARTLPEPEATPDIVGEADSVCRGQLAKPFVGQELDLATRTELLDAVAPQVMVRFLEPGSEEEDGSMNTERLNIAVNDANEITEVYCG
jgi:hypothetical protein